MGTVTGGYTPATSGLAGSRARHIGRTLGGKGGARMRLVLNGRFLGRPVTGVERLAIELTRAIRTVLAELPGAADVEVLAPTGMEGMHGRLAALGLPVPVLRTVGWLHGHAWEQTELAGARADAWLLSLCNVGPMLRRRQAAVICDAMFIDHPESFSRAFRWWYRVVVTVLSRRADAVFTISDFSRAALERHRLMPPGKAQVLPLGIDHMTALAADDGVLARVGLRPRGYLLAIGSRARHKNLPLLIDAFLDAGIEGIDLVIAGGGNRRIHGDVVLPEAANIRYIGRVDDIELKALYAHALAFACPSISEGFGFTPLEAMAVGCPVVASTGGALPEICGDAALYADPHDRAGWRDALRRIVADRVLRDELAGRAAARATLFTWRAAAIAMLTALAQRDDDRAMLAALQVAAARP